MFKMLARYVGQMFLEDHDGKEGISLPRVSFAVFMVVCTIVLFRTGNIPSGAQAVILGLLTAITANKLVPPFAGPRPGML
jgi:hypothetical protein